MSDIQFHPTRTLFIANLPWHLKQRQLNHYIKQNIPQCIEHVEAIVIPKKLDGSGRGFGFVLFKDVEHANEMYTYCQSETAQAIAERKLIVQFSSKKSHEIVSLCEQQHAQAQQHLQLRQRIEAKDVDMNDKDRRDTGVEDYNDAGDDNDEDSFSTPVTKKARPVSVSDDVIAPPPITAVQLMTQYAAITKLCKSYQTTVQQQVQHLSAQQHSSLSASNPLLFSLLFSYDGRHTHASIKKLRTIVNDGKRCYKETMQLSAPEMQKLLQLDYSLIGQTCILLLSTLLDYSYYHLYITLCMLQKLRRLNYPTAAAQQFTSTTDPSSSVSSSSPSSSSSTPAELSPVSALFSSEWQQCDEQWAITHLTSKNHINYLVKKLISHMQESFVHPHFQRLFDASTLHTLHFSYQQYLYQIYLAQQVWQRIHAQLPLGDHPWIPSTSSIDVQQLVVPSDSLSTALLNQCQQQLLQETKMVEQQYLSVDTEVWKIVQRMCLLQTWQSLPSAPILPVSIHQRLQSLHQLNQNLTQVFSNQSFSIHACGSFMVGMSRLESDIDIQIVFDMSTQYQSDFATVQLMTLARYLRAKCGNLYTIDSSRVTARIPVLTLRCVLDNKQGADQHQQLKLDIGILHTAQYQAYSWYTPLHAPSPIRLSPSPNVLKSLYMAYYFYFLSSDPRPAQLYRIVLQWSKSQYIHGAAEHKLSSFSWMLLVIYALQQQSNPVLPKVMPNHDSIYYAVQSHTTTAWLSQNNCSLFQLLLSFFRFYIEFSYVDTIVSVVPANATPDGVIAPAPYVTLTIQDPIELHENTARSLQFASRWQHIVWRMKCAVWNIQNCMKQLHTQANIDQPISLLQSCLFESCTTNIPLPAHSTSTDWRHHIHDIFSE